MEEVEQRLCHMQQEQQEEKMKLEERIRSLAKDKEEVEERNLALAKESEEGESRIASLYSEKEEQKQKIRGLDEELAQVREGMVSVRNDWALKQTALEEELLRLKTVEGQRDQEWMQERDKFVLERQAAEAETKKDREMMQGLKEQLRSALLRVDTLQQEQEERDREVQEERERAKVQQQRAREAEKCANDRGQQLETVGVEKVVLQQELDETLARLQEVIRSTEGQRMAMEEEVQQAKGSCVLLKEELSCELRSV
jgi:hypothetical protein